MPRANFVRRRREEVSGPGSGVIRTDVMVNPIEHGLPGCQKCDKGVLLPLSDYGRDGAPIHFKAWVCNNPECGFNIRIDNGEVSLGRSPQLR